MLTHGNLFVFEGPDGVGKSTLSTQFTAHLRETGLDVEHLTFPGRESGTLGRVIYDLHHEPEKFGVAQLTPASKQALHIAAHLDIIERQILPMLASGKTVVLDRFWWSTWVYGIVDGIDRTLLSALLEVEKQQWGPVLPRTVFLIARERSWRPDETQGSWQQLASTYQELARQEEQRYLVKTVRNETSIEAAMKVLVEIVRSNELKPKSNGGE
jgi:dTMP kinase